MNPLKEFIIDGIHLCYIFVYKKAFEFCCHTQTEERKNLR